MNIIPPPTHHSLKTIILIILPDFFHRSSADGDEDSDPCTSYPYMQFEANVIPEGVSRVTLAAAMCSRRYSLPVQAETFSRPPANISTKTNMDEVSSISPPTGPTLRHPSVPSTSSLTANFVRQYSFGERRRSLKQAQIMNDPTSMRAFAATRRRLFAGNRSPMISAVESLSSSESSNSASVAEGSAEKSTASSLDQDGSLTSPEENAAVLAGNMYGINNLDNLRKYVPNVGLDNVIPNNSISNCALDTTKPLSHISYKGKGITSTNITEPLCNEASKSVSNNQTQHRSVTFQVSGSSESSDNSKDNFDLDVELCKKLVSNMQRNLSNNENLNSPRRGSAPCNLLLNQINANQIALAARAMSVGKGQVNMSPLGNVASKANLSSNQNENISNSNRRGSLPIDLKSMHSHSATNNAQQNKNLRLMMAFEGRNNANCEARMSYATKRRQMAECRKHFGKHHSVDIGTVVSTSLRPPMLSRCSSLRSSSFGGLGGGGGNTNNNNISASLLDNYPSLNANNSANKIDNSEIFPNTSKYKSIANRRGSEPVYRLSTHLPLSCGIAEKYRCSLTLSDDGADHQPYPSGGNRDHPFGNIHNNHGASKSGLMFSLASSTSNHLQNENCCQPHKHVQQNHNSTPSLSSLLAREHLHAVQSHVQFLRNGRRCIVNPPSASTINRPPPTSFESQTLLDQVVNNCINNGNNSILTAALSTSNSANIRRGSLPTDFNFYNEFGVCQ